MKNGAFTPEWLARRLAALVPQYPDVSLCVALSGGVDSVTLLAALAQVRSRKRPALRAVHVHHGLHPDAESWSKHCAAIAKKLDVPLTTVRVNVARARGTSLEAAAREARYGALAKHLAPGEVLLTAHHADDQFETLLLQLLRGAGIAGLAAMPEVAPFARGLLVRPLLMRSRAELESWAASNGLQWVEDATNRDERLDRNYLRLRILPLIRARWPGAARAVSRSARHAAEAQRLLDALALADVERAADGAALSVQRLRTLSPERRKNAIRYWIARAGHPLPDATRLEEISRTLLEARPDANPSVQWNGSKVQRHADLLTLQAGAARSASAKDAHGSPAIDADGIEWHWRSSPTMRLGGNRGSLRIQPDAHGPLDLDALPERLVIHRRRGGERLRPHRAGRTRTLKALLQERRVPIADRELLPLLFANGRLIAVADQWLDASVQATSGTQRRARIRWLRS